MKDKSIKEWFWARAEMEVSDLCDRGLLACHGKCGLWNCPFRKIRRGMCCQSLFLGVHPTCVITLPETTQLLRGHWRCGLCGRQIWHLAHICGTNAHCHWYFVMNKGLSQSGSEHVKYHLQTMWSIFNLSMILEVEWKGLPSPHLNADHQSAHFILRGNIKRTFFF